MAGYLVYKYALKRLPDQPPLPRNNEDDEEDSSDAEEDETAVATPHGELEENGDDEQDSEQGKEDETKGDTDKDSN